MSNMHVNSATSSFMVIEGPVQKTKSLLFMRITAIVSSRMLCTTQSITPITEIEYISDFYK